jgi:hypothetical protein
LASIIKIQRDSLAIGYFGTDNIFLTAFQFETIIPSDPIMIFRFFKLLLASTIASLVLFGCGSGSSAPAPTGLVATASESGVTISWDMTSGVEYLFFYGPTSSVPSSVTSMSGWIGLPGGGTKINATSPLVLTGLSNGTSYSFSVNGRTNGGPGGPGATPVTATPRLAGLTWTAGANAGNNALRCVTYGASFVAAGDGGAMYSSADGVAWSPISYATTANLNGCSYWGSYRLVGDAGLVLTSPDAVTWTPQTSGTSENLDAIASNNVNLTVAVGANGTIITSPDGVTWTSRDSKTAQHLYAVNYSALNASGSTNGTWIAVGAAGTVVNSTDGGLTWTAGTVPLGVTADLRGIAYGASTASTGSTVFVAVGASGTILTSADGLTWSAISTTAIGTDLKAVTYGTQFVAVGASGSRFFSTDGVSWLPGAWTSGSAAGTNSDLNAVARGLLMYSAVGAGGANVLAK